MAMLTRRRRGSYPTRTGYEPVLPNLRREMDRLFDDFLTGFPEPRFYTSSALAAFTPSVDVSETDNEVKITAELPGMNEEDINVEVEEDTVTLSGEKKAESEDQSGNRQWREVRYGSFRRDIPLPAVIDPEKAEAKVKNGTLRVTLPKSAEDRSRRRSVKVSAE